MRTHAWAALLLIPAATAAETERTFPFTRPVSPQELQELAAVIRMVCEARIVVPQDSPPAVTVSGDQDLLGVAAWLIEALEQPSKEVRRTTYRGVPEGAVRVVFLDGSQQTQNELAAVVRALSETRRLATVSAKKAMVLRGSEEQARAAEWLVEALRNPRREGKEFRPDASRDEVFRAIFLPADVSERSLSEALFAIRAGGDVRKALTFSHARAIAVAAPLEQVALAVWMVGAIGAAPDPLPSEPPRHRYPDPVDTDTDVRVFYLSPQAPGDLLMQITIKLRRETLSRRIVPVPHARAILFRGTAEQAALAEQIFKEMRK